MRLGIDIGGTSVGCAVVGEGGEILAQKSIATHANRPYDAVIRDVANAALAAAEIAGCGLDAIELVGVGCPGILDRKTGVVIYSNNIAWENVPLVEELRRYLPKPIFVDNDANCAALGEFICGAAQGAASSVTVTLGTGVGGGIILDGHLLGGFNSAANVVGHSVIVSGGEQCNCGRKGCWETYASVTALIRMSNQAADQHPQSMLARARSSGEPFTGKSIFAIAQAGDAAALAVLETYYFYVAEGIIDLINILQPEVIVIGGGLSQIGDALLQPVERHVRRGVYCKQVPLPRIRIAELGNDAGIIGAAYLREHQRND